LRDLVSSGQIPQELIDESVRNVLRLKFALGLFERPYADEAREAEAMLRPEGISLARRAAERSFVLLKNSPGFGQHADTSTSRTAFSASP
jgi:beta-glucosidase